MDSDEALRLGLELRDLSGYTIHIVGTLDGHLVEIETPSEGTIPVSTNEVQLITELLLKPDKGSGANLLCRNLDAFLSTGRMSPGTLSVDVFYEGTLSEYKWESSFTLSPSSGQALADRMVSAGEIGKALGLRLRISSFTTLLGVFSGGLPFLGLGAVNPSVSSSCAGTGLPVAPRAN